MSDEGLPEAARGWNDRYAEGSTGWDLGEAPPVVHRVSQDVVEARRSQDSATPPRVLVPGCGRGHDAIGWAQAGATATGLDFAPLALEAAHASVCLRAVAHASMASKEAHAAIDGAHELTPLPMLGMASDVAPASSA